MSKFSKRLEALEEVLKPKEDKQITLVVFYCYTDVNGFQSETLGHKYRYLGGTIEHTHYDEKDLVIFIKPHGGCIKTIPEDAAADWIRAPEGATMPAMGYRSVMDRVNTN